MAAAKCNELNSILHMKPLDFFRGGGLFFSRMRCILLHYGFHWGVLRFENYLKINTLEIYTDTLFAKPI